MAWVTFRTPWCSGRSNRWQGRPFRTYPTITSLRLGREVLLCPHHEVGLVDHDTLTGLGLALLHVHRDPAALDIALVAVLVDHLGRDGVKSQALEHPVEEGG